MLRYAADENLNNDIVRGLRRLSPGLDIVRLQDEGLTGKPDPEVLDWCASKLRLLLTHDVNTMPQHLKDWLQQGKSGVGVLIIKQTDSPRRVLDDLILMAECSEMAEYVDRCTFLPLRS